MIYNTWDIIVVPFPFTDKNTAKKRPALVINTSEYQCKTGHLILLMITSAKNSNWHFDVPVADLNATGLNSASIIRFKVFSLDERIIIKKIGYLSERDREKVKEKYSKVISLWE